ncbi:MAG: hypothetical protein ACTHL3_03095 [Candidatus Nitrosocosmicus sp.]
MSSDVAIGAPILLTGVVLGSIKAAAFYIKAVEDMDNMLDKNTAVAIEKTSTVSKVIVDFFIMLKQLRIEYFKLFAFDFILTDYLLNFHR